METSYEDWDVIVEKVTEDIEHGEKTMIQIDVAVKCQKQTLEFAKGQRAKFPKPKKKPVVTDADEAKKAEKLPSGVG